MVHGLFMYDSEALRMAFIFIKGYLKNEKYTIETTCGPQSLKYLLSDFPQKRIADLESRQTMLHLKN